MPANKTVPTKLSVKDFLDSLANDQLRKDSLQLSKLMANATGKKPALWGSSIIGFGSFHYKYESGREGDQPIVSFAPRKTAISIYGLREALSAMNLEPESLGSCTAGKGCIYVKRLDEIDKALLEKVVKKAVGLNSKAVR